jgi:peptidoglycan/xylan/chitin deacetylase (PgdA/CDA1 family)
MTVHPLAFREQMELLAATGRPVLPLEAALARLRGEADPLPRGAVSITFDDGYRDNLQFAAPILARLGLRATVFLVTGRMGAPATIDRYVGCCEEDGALTWEEAREIGERGHALGGHGRTHRELASLDTESLRDEVFGCRDDLRRSLGSPASLFCYPRGSESPAVRAVVAEAGFQAAVTVYPGVNGPQSDPFLLRRTEVSGADDIADFRLKLDGAFDSLHRAWQRVRPRGA